MVFGTSQQHVAASLNSANSAAHVSMGEQAKSIQKPQCQALSRQEGHCQGASPSGSPWFHRGITSHGTRRSRSLSAVGRTSWWRDLCVSPRRLVEPQGAQQETPIEAASQPVGGIRQINRSTHVRHVGCPADLGEFLPRPCPREQHAKANL